MKAEQAILVILLSLSASICCGAAGDDDVRELRERGRAALERSQYQEAVEQFSEAIRLDPENHRNYNDRGVALKRMGNLDQALADYTKALEIRPGWPHALNNRGVGLMDKGRYREAIVDFTEALKKGKLESKLYTNRGIALARLGKHRRAIEDFRKAISHSPTDYRSFVELGRSLEKLGEAEKAYRIYQLAEGFITDPAVSRFLVQRTKALDKKFGGSLSDHSGNGTTTPSVSAKTPSQAIAGPSRGSVNKNAKVGASGNPDRAVTSSLEGYEKLYRSSRKKALKSFSRASGRLFRRGIAFERKADLPKALVMFEDSLQLAKRSRNLHGAAWNMLEMGRVYTRSGDPRRAAGYLRRALMLFRNLKNADEVLLALVESATASRAAGLRDKASRFFREAEREAQSSGRVALAQSLAELRTSHRVVRRAVAPAEDVSGRKKEEKSGRKPSGKPTRHMIKIGRGPVEWKKSERKRIVAHAAENLSTRKASGFFRSRKRRKIEQPQRESFWIKRSSAAKSSIADSLKRLKKLSESGDDKGMIVLLEQLAARYAMRREYDRALQCFTVSVATRDKLGLRDGMAKVLLGRGALREKRGRLAAALEDLTRAASLAKASGNKQIRKTALRRARRPAKRMGLDPATALRTFAHLWEARRIGSQGSETRLLYAIGALYEGAKRPSDALSYFERASAVIAVRSSDLLTEMGRTDLADRTRERAMGTLKKLDHSRYLQIIKKSKEARSLTRN